jgi:hypothetical protein
MKSETAYRRELIKKIERLLPGCFITKNDPSENQGIPDILILFRNMWAMLEVKLDKSSPKQPNQPYYVDKFNEMSFASFINPQNEDQVLDDLQFAFGVSRQTCVS